MTAIIHTAAGTSGTDSTPTLQAAIDTAPNDSIIILDPGTYNISGIIIRSSKITLRGAGQGVTVLQRTDKTPGAAVQFFGPTAGGSLEQLAIVGPYDPFGSISDPPIAGLYISGPGAVGGKITLRDVTISGFCFAIHKSPNSPTGNTDTLDIVDCDIQSYTGVLYPSQGTCRIASSIIRGFGVPLNNHYHGFYAYPDANIEVSNVQFVQSCPTGKGYGIHIFDQTWKEGDPVATCCQISRCQFDSSVYHGIITWSAPTLISNCDFATRDIGIQVGRRAAIVDCAFTGKGIPVANYPEYPFSREGYAVVDRGVSGNSWRMEVG